MQFIKRILYKWQTRTAKGYERYLIKHGVIIGKNLRLFNHKSIRIDTTSEGLIRMGNNVTITADVSILSHDFCSSVMRNVYYDYLNGRSSVMIGNNVYIGQKSVVCRGVIIGDNVIIGAGSIVTKDIPSNSVAAGVPARVICTLDEYHERRKARVLNDAKAYAKALYKYRGTKPTVEDFWEEFALFYNPHTEVYPQTFTNNLRQKQLYGIYDEFMKHNTPAYASFDEFLTDCLDEDDTQ